MMPKDVFDPGRQKTQPVRVDDDVALRMALTFKLELDGYVVEALQSGEALLEHTQPTASACLVVDQKLSGISAIETLAQLRSRSMSLPVLLVTSHVTPGLRLSA